MFPALNKAVRRFPARAVVITVALSFILFPVAVMLVTYTGIVLSDFLRKRRDYRFPHCPLEPVQVGDTTLKLFNYGHHTFKDMLDAIDAAQESIFLETYILKSDVIGQRFKRHIVRKAKEGVKVYIGFDGYGSLMMPLGFRQWPKEVSVSVFGPLHSFLQFFALLATVRNHRKILVIDNKIAYLGGMNIGREYAATWRDTHCRIEGPKAQDAALAFTELWNKRHGLNHRSRIDLPFTANSGDDQTIFLRESKPTGIFGHITIRDTYLEAFRTAQSHIWLTNPYFLPDHELERALLEALERGVQLDMIVPERSNHGIVDFLARGVYDRLLAGGANIWLYRHTVIHSKTCTIDAHWSTVGSANLDGRSLINYEINMFVNDVGFAERMEEMFRDDMKNCRPARRDEFSNPGRLRLLVETLAQPIRDLI